MAIRELNPPVAVSQSERSIEPGEAQRAALTLASWRDEELARFAGQELGAQPRHLVPGAINILLLYVMQLEELCTPYVSKEELAKEMMRLAGLFEP